MIGSQYWSTGIAVKYIAPIGNSPAAWAVSLEFLDDGFCGNASTEGSLRVRYVREDLSAMIDTLKADAERLGICFKRGGGTATVYMIGDGESALEDYPPNWKRIVNDQARRLGWQPCYKEE